MERFILDFDDSLSDTRVCKVSVTCHGLLKGLNNKWYGAPVFINGLAFCLHATIETKKTIRYLVAYLYCLSDLSLRHVECRYEFNLIPPTGRDKYSRHYWDEDSVFHGRKDYVRKQIKKLTDLLKKYYDKENDLCTVITDITDIEDVEPFSDSESENAESEAEAESENAEAESESHL